MSIWEWKWNFLRESQDFSFGKGGILLLKKDFGAKKGDFGVFPGKKSGGKEAEIWVKKKMG